MLRFTALRDFFELASTRPATTVAAVFLAEWVREAFMDLGKG